MSKITNNDLHLMLTEMRGDIKALVKDLDSLTKGFRNHTEEDRREFKNVNDNINSLNSLSVKVGAICTLIGAASIKIYYFFKGGA